MRSVDNLFEGSLTALIISTSKIKRLTPPHRYSPKMTDGFPNTATLAAAHSTELALSHLHAYMSSLPHIKLAPPPSSQAYTCQYDERSDVCEICCIMESVGGSHLQDTCLYRFVVNTPPWSPVVFSSCPSLLSQAGSQDSGSPFQHTCNVRRTRLAHKHLTPDPDHDSVCPSDCVPTCHTYKHVKLQVFVSLCFLYMLPCAKWHTVHLYTCLCIHTVRCDAALTALDLTLCLCLCRCSVLCAVEWLTLFSAVKSASRRKQLLISWGFSARPIRSYSHQHSTRGGFLGRHSWHLFIQINDNYSILQFLHP